MTFGTVGVDVLILGGGAHIPTHANNSLSLSGAPTKPKTSHHRRLHSSAILANSTTYSVVYAWRVLRWTREPTTGRCR